MESKDIFKQIKDLLNQFEREIEYDNSGEEFDINCYAEDFYAGLLNLIFKNNGFNLINLNRTRANFPAIDIGDEKNHIAYQISTTATPQKIQTTFDKFFSEKHKSLKLPEKYKKVYFLFLKGKRDILDKDLKLKKPRSFTFLKKEHIIDNSDIIKSIERNIDVNKKTDYLKTILNYIEKEIRNKPNYLQNKNTLQEEIKKSNEFGNYTYRFIHLSNYKKNTYEVLKKDLLERNNIKKIDFILFSGGLSAVDETITDFSKSFANKIKLIFKDLDLKAFIIAPGRMDTISDRDAEWQEKGIDSSLNNSESIKDFIKKEKILKNFNGILRIKEFKVFEKIIYTNIDNKSLSAFDSNLIINDGNKKIGLSSLNSSWRYYSKNKNCNIILGKEQVESSLEFIKECDIKIAVMHHPFDCLTSFDKKDIIKDLKQFDIVLFNNQFKTKVYTGFYENSFFEIAPSELFELGIESYSIIDYNLRQRKIKYELRTFDTENNYFKHFDNKIFKFPSKEELVLDKRNREFINVIQKTYIEDFDTHLVCYGISNTTQKLDDFFVLPLITDAPFYDSEDENIKTYTIENLIKIKQDTLIFGQKEAGKTILLDKILKSLTNNYSRLKIVPVYLNFLELRNKRIITAIKEYLAGQTIEIKNRLEKGNITLLIDNITFDDLYSRQLTKINYFKKEYPNVKIIATTLRTSEKDNLSMFISEHLKISFKYIYLQSFRTKQIKELINKWFSDNPTINEDKFDNILKSFRSFGFPRTPMAISIYLWIIEKQENKPINNAKLLEKFIESLLDKINKEEIYSEKFDFDNKIHLLAKIAKFMLDKENDNYYIKYTELIDYVHNYFVKQQFETVFDAQKIIDNLIERGIFIKNNTDIRFRFASFFHFFLAKQMIFVPEFKEYVLDIENYLNFTDEIDYYTGLERNAELILEILSERVDNGFAVLKRKISHQLINDFFETNNSVVDNIDFNNVIENKPTKKELEQMNDEVLEKTSVKKNIEKKEKIESDNIKLDRLLKLTANVLKNTEFVDKNEDLKVEVYKKVVKYNILLLFRDKFFYSIYYEKYNKLPNFIPPYITFDAFLKILPLLFQVVLYDWVGSKKISQVVLNKINEDKKNIECSDLEKFMSIFIYADIQAKDYPKIIKDYIKENAKSNTIRDLSFFKIMTYFYLRTKPNSKLEMIYLDLLAELKIRSKKFNKKDKAYIIEQLKEHKNKNTDMFEN